MIKELKCLSESSVYTVKTNFPVRIIQQSFSRVSSDKMFLISLKSTPFFLFHDSFIPLGPLYPYVREGKILKHILYMTL